MSTLKEGPIYRGSRIHTSSLFGRWISMIVRIGKRRPITKDSLTDAVSRIPGDYPSEEEAVLAAKRYIDAEDFHRKD